MRKMFYGALALGAALAISFSAGSVNVKAEGDDNQNHNDSNNQQGGNGESGDAGGTGGTTVTGIIPSIKTDGNDTLVVTTTGASKILVGVPAFKSNVKNGTAKDTTKQSISVSTWDVYDGETAQVDISKFAKTKDAYLMFKTDFQSDAEAVVVKIPASEKLSAGYDAKTGKITITKADKEKSKLPANTKLNYYTDSHSEGTIALDKDGNGTLSELSQYQMTGGSLYVETQSAKKTTAAEAEAGYNSVTAEDLKVSEKEIVNGTDAATAAKVKVYTFAPRSSKAVKLNIKKLANAPKVTANYVKGTIALPKGATAKFVSSDSDVNTAAGANTTYVTPADKTGTLSVSTQNTEWKENAADINASKKFAIDIFTTGDKDTKLASKTGRYIFDAQAATTLDTLTYEFTYDKKYIGVVKNTDPDNKYTIYYTDKDNKPKTATVGVRTKKKTNDVLTDVPGTVKLVNIKPETDVFVTRDGVAKTMTWIGTKEKWASASGKKESDATKYTVTVAKKVATETDTDVTAAVELIGAGLGNIGTFKAGETVTINMSGTTDAQNKLDAVTIKVDNADGNVDIKDGTISFKIKADKNTKITVEKKKFTVEVKAAAGDDSDADVKAAVTAIQSKVKGKTYYKGEEIKSITYDKTKVELELTNITESTGKYTLTSAAKGVITVKKAAGSTTPAETFTITVSGDVEIFTDKTSETPMTTLTGIAKDTKVYIKQNEEYKITVDDEECSFDDEGWCELTVTKNVTITATQAVGD